MYTQLAEENGRLFEEICQKDQEIEKVVHHMLLLAIKRACSQANQLIEKQQLRELSTRKNLALFLLKWRKAATARWEFASLQACVGAMKYNAGATTAGINPSQQTPAVLIWCRQNDNL